MCLKNSCETPSVDPFVLHGFEEKKVFWLWKSNLKKLLTKILPVEAMVMEKKKKKKKSTKEDEYEKNVFKKNVQTQFFLSYSYFLTINFHLFQWCYFNSLDPR